MPVLTFLRPLAMVFAAALAVLALTGAAAAERRVALVIANGAYEGAPLSNPTVDLRLVGPMLETMGFEVTAVENADFEAFDAAITEFAEQADGADLALFYFAGHGFALGEGANTDNYLMATSADVTSKSDRVLRRDGIPLDEIIQAVTARAKTSLIFVDACRNDPRVRSVGGGGGGRGLAPIQTDVEGDVFVGLSTRLGDVAADGEPGAGSPFARAFVAKMGTPGLNVPFAFNEVRKAVYADTGVQRPEANRVDLSEPEAVVLVAAKNADDPVVEPTLDPAVPLPRDKDYAEVARALFGTRFEIAGVCVSSNSENTARIATAKGAEDYMDLAFYEDLPDWVALVKACNAGNGEEVVVEVELEPDTLGSIDVGFLSLKSEKSDATITVPELAARLTEAVKEVGSLTGTLDKEADKLDSARVAAVNEFGHLVFFSNMTPRRTVDFLAACFQSCETVTFELEPIEFSPRGLSHFLFATDWSLPEGAAAQTASP